MEARLCDRQQNDITSVLDPDILPPYVVADLYKRRWRIEEAFYVVKRLLGLSYLWTGSINGVKLQVWATWLFYAVLVDLGDAVADELSLPKVLKGWASGVSKVSIQLFNYLLTVRGCLKSRLSSKKSSQGVSCKYVDTAPLRAMSKVYPSNLTPAQFELISGLIPPPKPGGRKREVDILDILNAIFYVLCEGCRWRALPGDFPNWQTVYTYFRNWRKDGTWVRMHDQLREWMRVSSDREPSPSEAIIDSQSVKSAALVSQAVGYDAGKKVKGRKRFLTVDTLGLVLRVLITAASVGEREGGKQVLKKVKQMGTAVSRLHTIWVDAGFDGNPFMQWVMDFCRWIVQVVLRPKECKKFVLLPKRWVVERTFGWLTWCRRLNKDYELLPETAETFIYIAMIRIMVRRLA